MKTIPRKRNGIYYRHGKEYASITKMISEVVGKPELMYWAGLTAAQIALADPTLTDKEVMAEFQLRNRKTQERGIYVHNIKERWDEVKPEDILDQYKGYYEAIKAFMSLHKPEPVHKEIEAFSDYYLTACRVDEVAVINGQLWSLDFKTGKDVYREVELQLTFGKHALKEDHGIEVQRTGVVLFKEDGGFKFEEIRGKIEDFEALLGLWNWKKRK